MKKRNINNHDNWATPVEFCKELDKEFHFDFDPCPYNHDMSWDGLLMEWGKSNFINPPYSRMLKEAFIMKAIAESKKGKICVMLLPVSTSTKIFHEYILPNVAEIRFVYKRLKFSGYNTKGQYVTNKCGMHDSMLIIFDGRNNCIRVVLNIWKHLKRLFNER